MRYEFKMYHSTTTTTPHRQRCYRSKKTPRKFFGVSSHEKRKWASQLIESRKGEGQPSKFEAKTMSTGSEGRPLTSDGVEVALSPTPGSGMGSREVVPLRTEPPALLHPLSRFTAEPSSLWGGATLQGSLMASSRHLPFQKHHTALWVKFACQI